MTVRLTLHRHAGKVMPISKTERARENDMTAKGKINASNVTADLAETHVEAIQEDVHRDLTAIVESDLNKAGASLVYFPGKDEGRTPEEFLASLDEDEPTVMGPIDKTAVLTKPIDSLMNSGVRETTGSAVVKLLEKVWARIRADHPELPEVVIVTGSGLVGTSKWGHFRANGWKVQEEGAALNMYMHELFMAGETLAKGAKQVLQTMLHEGAHTLAKVRDQKDTSRQGRWHNKTFQKHAEEMGLEHKGSKADKTHGYSYVTLTAETTERYADLLAELDREIHLMCDLPGWLGGTADEDDKGGERIGTAGQGKAEGGEAKSGNLKAVCQCTDPLIIRLSRKVLDMRVVKCESCDELFTAAES